MRPREQRVDSGRGHRASSDARSRSPASARSSGASASALLARIGPQTDGLARRQARRVAQAGAGEPQALGADGLPYPRQQGGRHHLRQVADGGDQPVVLHSVIVERHGLGAEVGDERARPPRCASAGAWPASRNHGRPSKRSRAAQRRARGRASCHGMPGDEPPDASGGRGRDDGALGGAGIGDERGACGQGRQPRQHRDDRVHRRGQHHRVGRTGPASRSSPRSSAMTRGVADAGRPPRPAARSGRSGRRRRWPAAGSDLVLEPPCTTAPIPSAPPARGRCCGRSPAR